MKNKKKSKKSGVTKFAVLRPADQTIVYLSERVGLVDQPGKFVWHDTTKHPEAHLFDSAEDAVEAMEEVTEHSICSLIDRYYDQGPEELKKWMLRFADDTMIETVTDEEEFRSREDTW